MTQSEALSWLAQRPDAIGECDRCHAQDVKLWALPSDIDREPEANWTYCKLCYRRQVHAHYAVQCK